MSALPALAGPITIYQCNLPPFNYQSETGQPTGIAVDVLVEIMNTAGCSVDLSKIKNVPLARSLRCIAASNSSILFSVAKTPKREKSFKWVGPIYNLKLGLISKKSRHIIINDKQDISKYKIGVIRESAPYSILTKEYGVPKKKLTLLTTDVQQFKMLNRGRVDLITQSNTGAPSMIRDAGLNLSDFEMSYVMMDLDLYFCLSKNFSDEFVGKLQQALKRIKTKGPDGTSTFDKIIARHLGYNQFTVHHL
ncbi:substrate-binding periplasmic protein [Maridesulfovibrio hydrothermalis]|nr:transporter substrate-binding domain-containing protein [Maridesulfovibrio hydrothermalis]